MTEISEATIALLQQKIGSLLFFGRFVDMMLLVALHALASTQSHGIEATARAMVQFLTSCATHPDTVIWYKNWHDYWNQHLCLIIVQAKTVQFSRRALLINEKNKMSPTYDEKWNGACGIHHHMQCNVICIQGQDCGPVSQWKIWCHHMEYIRRNGPPTACNAPTYRKLHSIIHS